MAATKYGASLLPFLRLECFSVREVSPRAEPFCAICMQMKVSEAGLICAVGFGSDGKTVVVQRRSGESSS